MISICGRRVVHAGGALMFPLPSPTHTLSPNLQRSSNEYCTGPLASPVPLLCDHIVARSHILLI